MHLEPENQIEALVCHCPSARHAERRLAFVAARATWPEVCVSFQDFCEHLARLGHERALPCHAASVYLCIACGRGDEAACRVLEARYLPALRALVSKFDARPDVIDDILQLVRCRLLVGPGARILSYEGRGSLSGWLRTVARTVALDHVRGRRARHRQLECLGVDAACVALVHAAPPAGTPEEEVHGRRHSQSIEGALCRAVDALPQRERRMLSLYYVGGLSIDQLGAAYGVDRSTIARQILRSVALVRKRMHEGLRAGGAAGSGREPEDWGPLPYVWLSLDAAEVLGHETACPGAAGDGAQNNVFDLFQSSPAASHAGATHSVRSSAL